MSVCNILVEGKDDLIFLRRLIEVMRRDARLPDLPWKLLRSTRGENVTILNKKFGNFFCEPRDGVIVVLTSTGGVYFDAAAEKNVDLFLHVKPESGETYLVEQIVGVFDADAPYNVFGNPVNFGGVSCRRSHLERIFSRTGIGRKFFLLPDDSHDKTLEDLVLSMVRAEYKFALEKNWPQYREGLKKELLAKKLRYLEYTSKCSLSQFSAAVEKSVAKDLYWVSALWEDSIWDWDCTELLPLKSFLHAAVPELFK